MTPIKLCERCNNAVISSIYLDDTDYYKHIRIKYCDKCREIVKREQSAKRMQALRKRRREENAAIRTQNELLKQENELIKENIQDYLLLLEYVKKNIKPDMP